MPQYVNFVFFCASIVVMVAFIMSHVIAHRRKAVIKARMAEDPVRATAEHIRRAFEKIALDSDGYYDTTSLQSLCGRAAVQFCLEAEKNGIDGVRLVRGEDHAFSRLSDGRIVDVTATQFDKKFYQGAPKDGYAPVEIGREHDVLPSWYTEKESWESVGAWLECGRSYHLYGARKHWEQDRKVVEETE